MRVEQRCASTDITDILRHLARDHYVTFEQKKRTKTRAERSRGMCVKEQQICYPSRAALQRQHCVNGDRLSQWEMANFGPLQNPNPLTNCQKIVTADYVRETTRYANFGANPSTGGFWANGQNITLNYFYVRTYVHIPFFIRGTTHRSDPSTDFDA